MQGDELLRSELSEPDEHAVRIEERLELAGAIHETVMPRLHAAALALAAEDLTRDQRNRAGAEVIEALRELRTVLEAPLSRVTADGPTLRDAVRDACSEFADLPIEVEDAGALPLAGGERASGPYAVGLVRHFLHEALRNVERHAEATRVRVAIQSVGRELRVTVENDGAVPGRNGTGLGLPLVRMGAAEQGGRVSWRSLPGRRWHVRLTLPGS